MEHPFGENGFGMGHRQMPSRPGDQPGAHVAALRARRDGSGLDHVQILRSDPMHAQGVVIGWVERLPFRLDYAVVCDAGGRSRLLSIALAHDTVKEIGVTSDGLGSWHRMDGTPLPCLDGCLDLDIAATPFTNTLPLRRLGLAMGDSVDLRVAHVAFPSLELSAVDQRYTRIGPSRYRYDAMFRGFSTELEFNEDQLVLDYPETFRRMSPVSSLQDDTQLDTREARAADPGGGYAAAGMEAGARG